MHTGFKDKFKVSKAGTSQKTDFEPPSVRLGVDETPLELPPSFRPKVEDRLKNLFFLRSSNTRASPASRGPSERGKSQECLPGLDTAANPNFGDENRSVDIKNGLREFEMGSVDRAFDEAIADTEDQSVDLSMAPQDSIHAPKCQVQAMGTIGGDVFREKFQQSDKGKDRDNQTEGLGGAGGLAAVSGHLSQDCGIPEADDREISRNQSPGIGGPSGQEITYDPTNDVASQLHSAHHFSIGGNPRFENIGVKNEYNHTGTYVLKEFVSFKALYNSSAQDPTRRVHPGTRQRVLKSIRDWIDTPSAKERIFWLHGPAGVGKSAIAQTIARSCAKGKLVATFFFYRSDPGRNDGNRLFTTLAWQFASTIPATRNALIHSLIECPDIPMTDVETQFEELIIKPLLELKISGVELSAPVVIIDGVDECSDDNLQRRFLKIIGSAVNDDSVPLRFLICSRPEAHIHDTMDIFRSITLSLDLAKLDDANQDIEKYLRAEFSRIASEQVLDPAWPGEEIIQEFVYKASGQFVYASTVIKYIGDEYSSAETQLDVIRGLKAPTSISPFADLDELYKEILRRQRDPVFLKDFLSLLIGRSGIEPDNLHKDDALLMNVSEKELDRKLRGMRSLLRFEPHIDIHHRSFLDFLQDSSRSGQYHISKQAGARRYLDFIAGSLVRYASAVIEGHANDHKTHFCPRFHVLASLYPAKIILPVEEWQQALQPLVYLQNKLLTLPNFRCIWKLLPCKKCTGFHTMRDLLLHLAFLLGASDRILDSAVMTESHADGLEEMQSHEMPLITTKTDANMSEKGINACLSSLLPRLRRGKLLGISFGADEIQLVCSLLRFCHAKTAMRLRSILDAQNLVDLIDELINSKSFCSDYSPDISCQAVHLALEIYTRVPVLPRSLFLKGTVGPHHDVWPTCRDKVPATEVSTCLFCMLILDPSYIVRVSWVYEEDKKLLSVVGKVNENNELLSQWRKRSNPSSVTRIPVMLEVAKALRYFHSMGITLHHYVDSDDIFLDSEFRAKFRFLGVMASYVKVTPIWYLGQQWLSPEANIFFFGCLFYEMCFDVKISLDDRDANNTKAVAKRPSKPEIRDDEWELIQRCCAKEPKSRPNMDEVVREMETWDIS